MQTADQKAIQSSSNTEVSRTKDNKRKSTFRPEVQGLRALAVLMVVVYHIWFDRVSGGVDIFLLISAFLMTLSFVRKSDEKKPFKLFSHWLHVFKRLLPAIVVVILGVFTAMVLFVPKTRWNGILDQGWSSLFYYQNWFLANQSVDYYATDDSVASPLQHFWSLSVQGQVFILWPILFALCALIARIPRVKFRAVTTVVFGLLFIASLIYSIHETSTNQTYAYFDTRARLWEFALGTLLALVIPYLKLPKTLAVLAGWIGIAGMLSAGFMLDVEGGFPGYIALWPLISASLIIVAGQSGSKFGVDRILSSKPLVRMGDMSYALYLWHWPILVIYMIYREQGAVGIKGGALIISASLILAYLTTTFIEKPVRNFQWIERSRVRSAILIVLCLSLVAAPLGAFQHHLKVEHEKLLAQANKDNPGAYALMEGFQDQSSATSKPLPDLGLLGAEWATLEGKCEGDMIPDVESPVSEDVVKACQVTKAEGEPAKKILVLGNSHSQQWLGALEPMAKANNYQITAVLLGGCRYGLDEGPNQKCIQFNDAVTQYALDTKPDVVFSVGTVAQNENANEVITPGLEEAAKKLSDAGIESIAIRDNPRFNFNMVTCLEENDFNAEKCTYPLNVKLAPVAPLDPKVTGIKFMDLTDLLCPEGICYPEVGNIYVYMDDNHLTSTYTKTTLPEFDKRFHAALGWKNLMV